MWTSVPTSISNQAVTGIEVACLILGELQIVSQLPFQAPQSGQLSARSRQLLFHKLLPRSCPLANLLGCSKLFLQSCLALGSLWQEKSRQTDLLNAVFPIRERLPLAGKWSGQEEDEVIMEWVVGGWSGNGPQVHS
jgi:hypothetical protein